MSDDNTNMPVDNKIVEKFADKKGDNFAAKSWYITLNNPHKWGFSGSPEEMCRQVVALWTADHPERACMVSFNISPNTQTPHMHMGLYSPKTMRKKAVRKLFPHADIKVAKGTKKQIYDYIHKTPDTKYEQKGEKVVCVEQYGEFRGAEISNTLTEEMYEAVFVYGLTVSEALEYNKNFYDKMTLLKQMYAQKRFAETPYIKENMRVIYHLGRAGSGKSYAAALLMKEFGEESVYVVSDYTHGFDLYEGQRVLFLDEFKGQARLADLLLWTDQYRHQQRCRYANTYMLWNEVHIASIIPPEQLYTKLIGGDGERESQVWEQISRRITAIIYHYKQGEEYCTYNIPMSEYTNYDALLLSAPDASIYDGENIQPISDEEQLTGDSVFNDEKPY
ncbi:MAG: hypothetical protein ACOYJB_08095 [Christensenellaceae bacterium]|jgi:hypothetical protein